MYIDGSLALHLSGDVDGGVKCFTESETACGLRRIGNASIVQRRSMRDRAHDNRETVVERAVYVAPTVQCLQPSREPSELGPRAEATPGITRLYPYRIDDSVPWKRANHNNGFGVPSRRHERLLLR